MSLVGAEPAVARGEGVSARFRRWKERLLDLSMRNRLLNFRVSAKGALPLEVPDLVRFGELFASDARLHLSPTDAPLGEAPDAAFVRRMDATTRTRLSLDLDRKLLHVSLPSGEFEQRARHVVRAARIDLEEGGANTLYLALGMLRWFEEEGGPARYAPLLLYPAMLEIDRVRKQARLARLAEDPLVNVTLIEKLRQDFGVDLSALAAVDADDGELDIASLLQSVRLAIAAKPHWEVLEVGAVGLFTFTKFLMWNDLAENEARFLQNPIIRHIAEREPILVNQPEQVEPAALDRELAPAALPTVMDADSTQLSAVVSALRGRSFVLQGPPGTGKSQTITNLIAAALGEGKSVLFVSEKMAALEVVKRRLEAAGLGDFCLELHSHKSQKKDVIASLCRSLDRAPRTEPGPWEERGQELASLRRGLSAHVEALHAPRPNGQAFYLMSARLLELERVTDLRVPAPGVEAMSASQLRARSEAIAALAVAGAEVAPVVSHPFRHATVVAWSGALEEAVLEAAAAGERAVLSVLAADARLFGLLGLPASARRPSEARAVCEYVLAAMEGPVPPAALGAGWSGVAESARAYAALSRARDAEWAALSVRWTGALFNLDLEALHRRYVAWATAFILFRWMFLFTARRALAKVASGGLPVATSVQADLARAVELRRQGAALSQGGQRLEPELGGAWRPQEGAAALEVLVARGDRAAASVVRVTIGQDLPGRLLGVDRAPLLQAAQQVDEARGAWEGLRARLSELLALQGAPGEGEAGADEAWGQLALGWRQEIRRLRPYCHYRAAMVQAESAGLAAWAALHHVGQCSAAELPVLFEKSELARWVAATRDADAALRGFDGAAHHHLVERFAALDREHIERSRAWVVSQLEARLPGPRAGAVATSEPGILRREQQKKTRHLSVRRLLQATSSLLPRLKPCLLMSPLSVAQYLSAAGPLFDLVVFDEASQIGTHDAIGALARGKQMVVVGDSKQLPPTLFFQRAAQEDEELDEDEVVELESVLDEALAKNLPEQTLGWHYRSRHDALIDFSNRHYYEGRLNVFPAASQRAEGLGVAWHPVPDGVYLSGEARTNPREGQALVQYLVGALRRHPPGSRTFGVVTFSMAQRGLIEDLLEEARALYPEIEPHFSGDEGTFVKNLENVQGDERDEILFSIGYAKDEAGKLRMHFGPLSNVGGERRLNVAVTRARQQLRVFSTLTHDQIDLGRTQALGAQHLRQFLEYAWRRGGEAAQAAPESELPSAFERDVRRALLERGHQVHAAIGCGAYRVDLAVEHPARSGEYLLGVELDGPAYASGQTARDRDRLRAQVLGSLGWRMHRIWSADWWFDRERELGRLHAALQAALEAYAQRSASAVPSVIPAPSAASVSPTAPSTPEPAPHTASDELPQGNEPGAAAQARAAEPPSADPPGATVPLSDPRITPYRPVPLEPLSADLYSTRAAAPLRERVLAVVRGEGPIHQDELMRRVLRCFGVERLTARPRRHLDQVLAELARRAELKPRGEFIWRADVDPELTTAVRVTDASAPARPIDQIAPEELAAGAALILSDNLALPRAALVRETARLFGSGVGSAVTASIEVAVELLEARGLCISEDDRVRWRG